MKIEGFSASNGWFDRFTKRIKKTSKLDCLKNEEFNDLNQTRSSDFLNNLPTTE